MFRMRLEATVSAAQLVAERADQLAAELHDIERFWDELTANWVGLAASAYRPVWDEWHENANTIAEILMDHSDLLMRSASLVAEHEGRQVAELGSLERGGRAR